MQVADSGSLPDLLTNVFFLTAVFLSVTASLTTLALVAWTLWWQERRDRHDATTTLRRVAETGSFPEERIAALRSLGDRLNSLRSPPPDNTEEPELEAEETGIEITAGL